MASSCLYRFRPAEDWGRDFVLIFKNIDTKIRIGNGKSFLNDRLCSSFSANNADRAIFADPLSNRLGNAPAAPVQFRIIIALTE